MNTFREKINAINLVDIAFATGMQRKEWFLAEYGEHYKLLAFISQVFKGQTIFDIGTFYGESAVALAHEPSTKVISYDIVDLRRINNPPSNVEFRLGDFRNDSKLLSSPFIFIDVDPHDGTQEADFHKFFLESGYKGITMWDDIHLNPQMNAWWDSINDPSVYKHDITEFGHFSGTGMIIY
jgi:hypothetical protein